MYSPLVSVIIPVYNTGKYLKETLTSISNQSLKELEIIVVNDGSTDNSLSIIESQAKLDTRIQIYTQENKGVSVARNKALQHIKGEYIYFLDSDDILAPQALEICYKKCKQENLDFIYFDAENINPDNKYQSQNYIHSASSENTIQKGIEVFNDLIDSQTYRPTVWLHFIKTAFLKAFNLSFYPGIIHEDQLFCFYIYMNAQRVSYIPQIFIKRRLRENSIMTQKFSWKNIIGYFTVINEILKYKKNQSIKIQKTIDKFLTCTLNAILWNSHVLNFKEKCKIIQFCTQKRCIKYIHIKNLAILFLKDNRIIYKK